MALSRKDTPTADISKQMQSFNAAVSATPQVEETADKSVMISMRIPESLRNELKAFFASHGMSLSSGLIASANYLKLEEQMGSVNISNGIVIKRK